MYVYTYMYICYVYIYIYTCVYIYIYYIIYTYIYIFIHLSMHLYNTDTCKCGRAQQRPQTPGSAQGRASRSTAPAAARPCCRSRPGLCRSRPGLLLVGDIRRCTKNLHAPFDGPGLWRSVYQSYQSWKDLNYPGAEGLRFRGFSV